MASSSSSSSLSFPSSSLSRTWDYNVFPSFHGPDVRKRFLSHLLDKFERKGIKSFIDNEIKRGESICPELKRAIKGSKIAIVLLSKNYAASSWCLDELVEIMNKELGQTVITIFYEVAPTDVKKQIGDFGTAFEETCKGKTEEKIGIWRKALEGVATIAGYDSKNWDNEAAMIEIIAADISDMLNIATPSRDFDDLVGMEAHMAKMEPLLRLDLDEVRMIGIWGLPGIGKTTIAQYLFNQYSSSFQLSTIMMKIKGKYPVDDRCLDEHSAKLKLQSQMLSQMLNHKDMKVTHLGVAQERLKENKVLLVLDDVDRAAQLDALAKETRWFGPGSRIIVTTQDQGLLMAHGINDIYEVDFPSTDLAFQMFCMYAFGQKYPKDGFEELAREVANLACQLPLGLKVLGSHYKGKFKKGCKNAPPSFKRTRLHTDIETVLKFSYDALFDDEKKIFLHIACYFNYEEFEKVVAYLATSVEDVREGIEILVEKSLIYMERGRVMMHDLLAQLGRDIGQRQYLVGSEKICEVLGDDEADIRSVIGIDSIFDESELPISGRAFEIMSNLQFLRLRLCKLHLPHGLSYLSPKLRLLDWNYFPATCLPSNVNLKFLVKLNMRNNKLEKLWDEIKPLPNLKWMDLSLSESLKELPNLSTAINLQRLLLNGCTSLVEVPASIGSLHKLELLDLSGCSKLEVLPIKVNLKSLDELHLRNCSSLKIFPEISTNIRRLYLDGTAIEEVPSSIRSWSRLKMLDMSNSKNLKKFMHDLDSITERDTNIQEVSPLAQEEFSGLKLILYNCKNLVSLPRLSHSLSYINVGYCESLERLDCSLCNLCIFTNCFKLNKEARDLIIETSNDSVAILPGKEIPTYFTHRGGGFLTVKLKKRPFPSSLKFKVCFLLVKNNDSEDSDEEYDSDNEVREVRIQCRIMDGQNHLVDERSISVLYNKLIPFPENLYIFPLELLDVPSNKFCFQIFTLDDKPWVKIKDLGVHCADCEAAEEVNEDDCVDEEEGNGEAVSS